MCLSLNQTGLVMWQNIWNYKYDSKWFAGSHTSFVLSHADTHSWLLTEYYHLSVLLTILMIFSVNCIVCQPEYNYFRFISVCFTKWFIGTIVMLTIRIIAVGLLQLLELIMSEVLQLLNTSLLSAIYLYLMYCHYWLLCLGWG